MFQGRQKKEAYRLTKLESEMLGTRLLLDLQVMYDPLKMIMV